MRELGDQVAVALQFVVVTCDSSVALPTDVCEPTSVAYVFSKIPPSALPIPMGWRGEPVQPSIRRAHLFSMMCGFERMTSTLSYCHSGTRRSELVPTGLADPVGPYLGR